MILKDLYIILINLILQKEKTSKISWADHNIQNFDTEKHSIWSYYCQKLAIVNLPRHYLLSHKLSKSIYQRELQGLQIIGGLQICFK